MSNPLLDFNDLPLFDQVRPEHVAPAMDELLAAGRRGAGHGHRSPTSPPTGTPSPACWTSPPSGSAAPGAWWATSTRVADTPGAARRLQRGAAPVTEFWTRLGSDERLYAKYKAIDSGHAERRAAPGAQERHAQLRAVRRRTRRARPRSASPPIQERQAELSQKFSENALDATDAFAYYAARRRTRRRAAGRGAGRARGGRGRRQGRLQAHAEDAQLPAGHAVRATTARCASALYRAYVTRASDQGDPKFDNSAADARDPGAAAGRGAGCWAIDNFAEVSVVPKMAESPEAGDPASCATSAQRARPYAEKDVADMRAVRRGRNSA